MDLEVDGLVAPADGEVDGQPQDPPSSTIAPPLATNVDAALNKAKISIEEQKIVFEKKRRLIKIIYLKRMRQCIPHYTREICTWDTGCPCLDKLKIKVITDEERTAYSSSTFGLLSNHGSDLLIFLFEFYLDPKLRLSLSHVCKVWFWAFRDRMPYKTSLLEYFIQPKPKKNFLKPNPEPDDKAAAKDPQKIEGATKEIDKTINDADSQCHGHNTCDIENSNSRRSINCSPKDREIGKNWGARAELSAMQINFGKSTFEKKVLEELGGIQPLQKILLISP